MSIKIPPRCDGITNSGVRCTNSALYGNLCGLHKKAHERAERHRRDPYTNAAKRLYQQHRSNAKARNIKFAITEEFVFRLLRDSGGVCEVTKVAFCLKDGSGRRRPYHPSIDRKDSTKGYTPGNCRVVIAAANLAMNEWGEDVIYQMARGLYESGFFDGV